MAVPPSNIPNHPRVQLLDWENDAFPTGSSYYIKNVCSSGNQALTFNHNVPGATTCPPRDVLDCKWFVQFDGNDRSKVALKDARTGKYLASSSPNCKAQMCLNEYPNWWYVYQGGVPGSYWLGTTQVEDGFLHTWDCYQGEGAYIGMFTNRDANSGTLYNMPYSEFEKWSYGMSWALDPTPELKKWKDEQKQAANKAQNDAAATDELRKREQAVAEKEKQAQQVEADVKQRSDDLAKREQELASKEQAIDEKVQSQSKADEELKKREEAVSAAEERIKKNKKGGKAEHLATQEEADSLKGETKDLQKELDAARSEIKQLRQQLHQAQNQQRAATGSGNRISMNGYKFPSIRTPEAKRPERKLPERKLPPQTLPGREKPSPSLPKGYNTDMLKRFEVGRKAMSTGA